MSRTVPISEAVYQWAKRWWYGEPDWEESVQALQVVDEDAIEIGRVLKITYVSSRSGQTMEYHHDFGPRVMLFAMPEIDALLITGFDKLDPAPDGGIIG